MDVLDKYDSAGFWEAFNLPNVKCNMGLMIIQWTSCSFTYYLMFYMTNSFENIYWAAIGISCADTLSYIISAFMVSWLGPKRTFTYSWFLTTIFSLLILVYGLDH